MKSLQSKWGLLALVLTCAVIAHLSGHDAMAAVTFVPFLTVGAVPGMPDYTQSGTNKMIPYAFSKKTIVKFYDTAVVPKITNTDYQGEISAMGDKVIINTTPTINVSPYSKGQTTNWQNAEAPAVEMTIDRAIQFAFKMDKIDIKQFQDKAFMEKCAQDAAEQQKIYIDNEFFGSAYADAATANKGATAGRKSASYNLGTTGSPIALTKTNILDKIIECSGIADEQNWPESDRWMVIPSWATVMLKVSDLKDATMTGDGKSTLRTGRLGQLDFWELYSTNLYTPVTDGGKSCYNIMFGHKSGISFASQLIEVEYFDKLETTFGKGMKGLQVYDWKTTKPESVGVLYAHKS